MKDDKDQALDMNQKAKAQVRTERLVLAGLLILSVVPVLAGSFRLTQLAGGATITADNARFFASPIPVVIHIVCASLYAILGAFQITTGFRRRRPGWHRAIGLLLIPCGLLVGSSGLWMTMFYPRPVGTGDLLSIFRLLFGSGMIASIVIGYIAIRQGDVVQHRAWMLRAYAIGMGAGTQVLTQLGGTLIFGQPNELGNALLMGAGWVINLAVAEWVIRKQVTPSVRAKSVVAVHS